MRCTWSLPALTTVVCFVAAPLWAASSLDPTINSLRTQLQNANSELKNLENQQSSLKSQQAALKKTQSDNTKWIDAQPALVEKANADVASQKDQEPGLKDKLKTLTDGDAERVKTIAADQASLLSAKAKLAKMHDDAFAAYVSTDPGMSLYKPVSNAKSHLAAALQACKETLEKTAAFQDAMKSFNSAEARLTTLRKSDDPDLNAISMASRADLGASNRIEKMRTAAADNDPEVKAASQDLAAATAAFKPTMDAFDLALSTQPDYAAALKEVADDQTALTTAQAASKQAAADEIATHKQITELESKGNAGASLIKSSAADTAAKKNQNAAIDRQLASNTQTLTQLEQSIASAKANVSQLQQQLQANVNARTHVGG